MAMRPSSCIPCPTSRLAHAGFSLLELSIVLAIVGLLTGGVIAGQSLIRAAELRSITTELTGYVSAAKTFRDKYGALPGDMSDATSVWGDNVTHCADAAITNGSPGTCNGDGDGLVEISGAVSTESERFMFWNQLALANILPNSYDGIVGASNTTEPTATNSPRGKNGSLVWTIHTQDMTGVAAADLTYYAMNYQNMFFVGGFVSGCCGIGAFLTPSEAFSIDSKIDDGLPAKGNVIRVGGQLAAESSTCALADDGTTTSNDFNASYNTALDTTLCAIAFMNQLE
jgi:prepilin-type N-terminal cleavage/methylation domain-containing protein